MAIFQALLTLIGKSAGKVLNAIFGWAVRALFGQTTSGEQTFLSAVVGAAVAWPLLLVGLIAPKIAALLLAFVPIPHWIPSWTIRLVWLGLAVLVPLGVGLAVASKAPPHMPHESFIKRTARGFPITVGLAIAFLIMFFSVPVMRLAALVRRLESADIPLMTDGGAYEQVADRISDVLMKHGFALHRAQPRWWVSAPIRILTWFGGDAFRAFVPSRPAHFVSADLEMSLYPSGVLLRGKKDRVTWAHGLIAETVVHTDGLQTTDAKAQDLEKQLRRLWKLFDENPAAHASSPRLLGRLQEITQELGSVSVPFDDWQVLYRQILQVERALRGERQLLDDEAPGDAGKTKQEHTKMAPQEERVSAERVGAQQLDTGALLKEIGSHLELLAKKQFELATTELKADLQLEVRAAGGLGIAALTGLAAINLLLVTGVLGLSQLMPGWLAGLIVSGAVLLVASFLGLVSWRRRLRDPMSRTRKTLKDDAKWTRERLA